MMPPLDVQLERLDRPRVIHDERREQRNGPGGGDAQKGGRDHAETHGYATARVSR
jgi:glycerophosphoryl diester phosphodiesterase